MTHSKPMARVVGAGFVGLACALELQADGFEVELLDASAERQAASYGNAGHLATEQLSPLASWRNVQRLPRMLYSRGGPASFPMRQVGQWLPFGIRLLAACSPARFKRGLACNKALLAQAMSSWHLLLQRIGQADLLCQTGHRVVWESAKTAQTGMQAWLATDCGSSSAAPLTHDAIESISKQFAGKPMAGLQFSGTGHIRDLHKLRAAMCDVFVANGGVWRRRSVLQIRKTAGGSQIIVDDVQASMVGHPQDLIVVCAGVSSGALLRDDFGHLPMIAERGYHLQLDQKSLANSGLDQPIVFEDRSLIITPFAHGLRLASFTEFSTTQAPADASKWQRLMQHAAWLGIQTEPDRLSQWMGSRPTLPDYLPAIGRSRSASNLILACGHNHLGLTLAAVTGRLVRELARRQNSATSEDIDISALAPERYIGGF